MHRAGAASPSLVVVLAVVVGCSTAPPEAKSAPDGTGDPSGLAADSDRGGAPAPARRTGHERLLPADVLVYVTVDDIARTRTQLGETALASILAETSVQRFLERPLGRLRQVVAEVETRAGIELRDVAAACAGQVSLSVLKLRTGPRAPEVVALALADVTGPEAAARLFDRLAQAVAEQIPDGWQVIDVTDDACRKVRITNDELGIAMTFALTGNLAIVAFNPPADDPVPAIVAGRTPPAGASLADSGAFGRATGLAGPERVYTAYGAVAPLREAIVELVRREDPEAGARVSTLLSSLGLDGITHVASGMSVDPPGLKHVLYVRAPAPRGGLFTLLGEEPLDEKHRRLAPVGAMGCTALRVRPAALMPLVRRVASDLGGSRELDGALAQLRATLGFDVESDLLASLGEQVAVLTFAADASADASMAGYQGICAAIELRDAAKARQIIDTLVGFADIALRAQGTVRVERAEHRGVALQYAGLAGGVATPCVAVTGDHLVVAGGIASARRMIDLLTLNAAPLVATGEYRRLAARVGIEGGPQLTCGDPRQSVPQFVGGLVQVLPTIVDTTAGSLTRSRDRAMRAQCMSHLTRIGIACHVHSTDHQDAFSTSLDDLVPDYIADRSTLECPCSPGGTGYSYVGGLTGACSPTWVLAFDVPANHGEAGLNCLFLDGHVEWLTHDAFQTRLQRTLREASARGVAAAVVPGASGARPGPGAVDGFADWVDLRLLPEPSSYAKHLFGQLDLARFDVDGIAFVGYGPFGGSGAPTLAGVAAGGVAAGLVLPALSTAREKARRTKCMSNLKQIGIACHVYATDCNDRFPGAFADLVPRYIEDEEIFRCPSRPGTVDYVYVSGLTTACRPSWVLAYDKGANHRGDGRNVLFLDGHVEWVVEGEFVRALARTREGASARDIRIELLGEDDAGGGRADPASATSPE